MEVTSDEYLSEVRSLLNCPSKITRVRNLRGDEAQMFIDSLDRVSKLGPCFSVTYRVKRRFLHDHASMTNTGNAVYGSSPRSAEHAGSYPPRIFFNKTSYKLGHFIATAGAQS